MHYIDLNDINEEHIRGNWEVVNREGNIRVGEDLFADIRIIDMDGQEYRSVNGKERRGEWQVVRAQKIIYNPQIKFFIAGQQVGNALITRLRAEPSGNAEIHKLTLYFNTGLELVLRKTN